MEVYGLTEDNAIAEKERFMETIQEEIDRTIVNEELIIAGGLPVGRTGNIEDDITVGP